MCPVGAGWFQLNLIDIISDMPLLYFPTHIVEPIGLRSPKHASISGALSKKAVYPCKWPLTLTAHHNWPARDLHSFTGNTKQAVRPMFPATNFKKLQIPCAIGSMTLYLLKATLDQIAIELILLPKRPFKQHFPHGFSPVWTELDSPGDAHGARSPENNKIQYAEQSWTTDHCRPVNRRGRMSTRISMCGHSPWPLNGSQIDFAAQKMMSFSFSHLSVCFSIASSTFLVCFL